MANQWRLIGLPLNVGDANTVYDLFADDLDPPPGPVFLPSTYGDRWGLYDWDADTQQYRWLDLFEDPLDVGKGYWLMTLDSEKIIDVGGTPNPEPMDIPLLGDLAGRLNLVGYPYVTDMCWADAQVVQYVADSETVLNLSQADPAGTCWITPAPNCVMSRIMFKWNGAAYEAYDGQTPGAEGTLSAFDGLWVNAFKDGLYLRLTPCPDNEASALKATTLSANSTRTAATVSSAAWWLRLTVASGALSDPGNLLGRLSDSRNGYDAHDLPELAPPVSPYLTLVFPRPNWGAQSRDYTTDYRQAGKKFQGGVWDFEVRSDVARTITLSGEASTQALAARSRLFDQEAGRWLKSDKEGRYTFNMVGPVHRLFLWVP